MTFRFTWWGVRGLLVIDGYGPVWSGRTYRLRVGGRAGVPFTAGRPARFRGPVRLHPSLGARGRQAVRTAVRGAHPQVRRMWSDLGGALTVRRGRCVVGSSCTTGSWPEGFTITMSARDIGPSRVQRRVLLHEFGHVVDRAGIPAHRRARFASTLVRRPGYRCRQPRRQDDVAACPPVGEWWAEEFARFADSYRGPSRSAYGTPPVFRQAEFARMLREWWEPGVTVVASAPGG